MKIGNFGSFDPTLRQQGIVGLGHVTKLDQKVWDDFNHDWDALAYKSEQLLQNYLQRVASSHQVSQTVEQSLEEHPGLDVVTLQKTRVNQEFFRQVVLANYNYCCCITGLGIPELLVASHIVPWAVDQTQRTNPANGLCLNALHDRAFDRGLITLDDNLCLLVSKELEYSPLLGEAKDFILSYRGRCVAHAERFQPHVECLAYHRQQILKG